MLHTKKSACSKKKRTIKVTIKTTEFILNSNKLRATINGSTLSIGYIHQESQYIYKRRVMERNRREIIFGYTLKATIHFDIAGCVI